MATSEILKVSVFDLPQDTNFPGLSISPLAEAVFSRALNRHVERAFNPDRKARIGESAS
jgi:hypothetical protein